MLKQSPDYIVIHPKVNEAFAASTFPKAGRAGIMNG
jgi:hypothetical protein